MIDNYLDWVKGQRKVALHEMYHARELSRLDPTPWGTGFYAGHAQAHSFEARHWRRLQKDIEARIAHDHRIVVMPAHRDGYDEILS